MSRTDQDMPQWVTRAWVSAHTHACTGGREGCALPARPARQRPHRQLYRTRACHWVPPRRWRPSSPPRWFVNAEWTAGDRMHVRAAARRAISEHRATRVVDTEARTDQHHHGARWHWN